MTDSPGSGFHTGEDGTIYADPGAGAQDETGNWTWKQIEAAITGMAAGPRDAGHLETARTVADPESLMTAALLFRRTYQALTDTAFLLTSASTKLAGPDGTWKGAAADSFLTAMKGFSQQVTAAADVLSGGASGRYSVFQQLADNAETLANAQNKIMEIDYYYAGLALAAGSSDSGSTIPISKFPKLVENMTADMRVVLSNLSREYQLTINNVVAPAPITSPTNSPDEPPSTDDGSDGKEDPGGDTGGDKDGGTGDGSDDSKDGGTGDGSTSDSPPEPEPAPFPGGLDLGGGSDEDTGGAPPPLSPFPDGTDLGQNGLGDLGGLDDLGHQLTGPLDLGDLGGLNGLSDLGALSQLSGLNGLRGLSGLNGPSTFKPSSASFSDGDPLGLRGELDSGAHEGPTESIGPPAELSPSTGTTLSSSGPVSGLSGASTGGMGMPMMPGGGGAAGQQTPNERSDASGLLDADGTPWVGLSLADDEVGATLGATAGGAVLDLPDGELALSSAEEEIAVGALGIVAGVSTAVGTGGARPDRRASTESVGASAGGGDHDDPWNEPWTGEFDRPDAAEETGEPAGVVGAVSTPVPPAPVGDPDAGPTTAAPPAALGLLLGSDGHPLPGTDGPDAPAPAPVPARVVDPDSAEAWDVAGSSFVPLLWTVPTAPDPEVVIAGRRTAASTTWTSEDHPGASTAGDEPTPAGSRRARWRPKPVGASGPGVSVPASAPLFCGEGPPEAEEFTDLEDAPEEQPEEAPAATEHAIADLLVQEREAWGSTAPEGPDALV